MTRDGHVLLVVLDRPDRLNAVTPRTVEELLAAFDRSDGDDDVRAVVVTGRGRAFCAGADVSQGTANLRVGEFDPEPRDGGGRLSLRIYQSTKPVIAAVNGPAVGIGLAMTLPMDARIASTDARFGFPYVRRGICPEGCSSWFLPRVVGIGQALDWMVSGRVFGADEALSSGLVRAVVDPADLLDAAYGLAEEIATWTSPVSVATTRRLLWRMLSASEPFEAHVVESRLVPRLAGTADADEGVRSFLERRRPRFTGRVTADLPDDLGPALDDLPNVR